MNSRVQRRSDSKTEKWMTSCFLHIDLLAADVEMVEIFLEETMEQRPDPDAQVRVGELLTLTTHVLRQFRGILDNFQEQMETGRD